MSMNFMPNGNIGVSRFVKQDTTKVGGYVLQAGAGDYTIGVSQAATRQAPIAGLDDGYAGVQDSNSIEVLTENDEGLLEAGGTVSYGDLLKSDTNGKGVTADTDKDWYGARALQSGISGQLIRVRVESGYLAV